MVFETIDDVARLVPTHRSSGASRLSNDWLEAVDRARGHEPSGWLVAGDAGVGKTRYLDEVGRRPPKVARGSSRAAASTSAPVACRTCRSPRSWRSLPTSDIETLPALAALTGAGTAETAIAEVDTDSDRRLPLFDAVRALLTSAGERPMRVVVVLEDVHWADRSSRDLLHFLLARLRVEPVVIVASFRTDDLHRRHPLRQLVSEVVRLPLVERIDLPPFDADELAEYLAALTEGPVDERTVAAVLERSEGNAYFAEELMSWHEGGRDGLPAGLADILLSRVERLGPDAQHLVRVASVAGRRVTDDVLVEERAAPRRLTRRCVRRSPSWCSCRMPSRRHRGVRIPARPAARGGVRGPAARRTCPAARGLRHSALVIRSRHPPRRRIGAGPSRDGCSRPAARAGGQRSRAAEAQASRAPAEASCT